MSIREGWSQHPGNHSGWLNRYFNILMMPGGISEDETLSRCAESCIDWAMGQGNFFFRNKSDINPFKLDGFCLNFPPCVYAWCPCPLVRTELVTSKHDSGMLVCVDGVFNVAQCLNTFSANFESVRGTIPWLDLCLPHRPWLHFCSAFSPTKCSMFAFLLRELQCKLRDLPFLFSSVCYQERGWKYSFTKDGKVVQLRIHSFPRNSENLTRIWPMHSDSKLFITNTRNGGAVGNGCRLSRLFLSCWPVTKLLD